MSKSVSSVSESQFVEIVWIILYQVTQNVTLKMFAKSPASQDADA